MKDEIEKRLFIGIHTGRVIEPILSGIQSSLAHNSGQIRWLSPKNIHMTLFFLGNVFLVDIPKLTKALDNEMNLNHFRVSIFKTGVFPLADTLKYSNWGLAEAQRK